SDMGCAPLVIRSVTAPECHAHGATSDPRRTLADVALPGRSRRDPEPVRITDAPTNHREDLNRRRRTYGISMGIRTLCFDAAVVVVPGGLRGSLVAAALILPYFAVVMAN